jgi:hypothetical protein
MSSRYKFIKFKNSVLDKQSEKDVYHNISNSLRQYNLISKNLQVEVIISRNTPWLILIKTQIAVIFVIRLLRLKKASQQLGI